MCCELSILCRGFVWCGSSFVECVSSFVECVCVLEGLSGGGGGGGGVLRIKRRNLVYCLGVWCTVWELSLV